MHSRQNIRKSVLSMAMGLCLTSLAAAPAFAQSATGGVAGRANAGETITVTSTTTGLSRTVTVGKDGSYRIGQLPPGSYSLKAGNGAAVPFTVDLGNTTTVNLKADTSATNLEAVQVIGSRVVNHVDVHSTGASTVIDRQELARLPVGQSMGAVALLAPGVIKGNSSFGGISFGGSSVAENQIYINGLNVTDFYKRQGNSSAPFAFFDQFQVKTGGYSVEYGRSTGGVVNASVRAGGNEFHGGTELTFEPAAFNAPTKDHVFVHQDAVRNPTTYALASRDRSSLTKANIWASGPIVKDRVFFFAMYENQDYRAGNTDNTGSDWTRTKSNNGFWGTRLDWNITDDHTLSLMAFSDKGQSTASAYGYDWATEAVGAYGGDTMSDFGGKNYTLTYTGHFGENFVAKAMYGENDRNAFTHSVLDAVCNPVDVDGSYTGAGALVGKTVGCHPTGDSVFKMNNTRKIGRLDFEWALGDHLLRFGLDREQLTTVQSSYYPGPGGDALLAMTLAAGTEIVDGSGVFLAQDTDLIRKRHRVLGGQFVTVNNAYYLEDNWNITDNFLLNLGLRIDNFKNKTAAGAAFIDIKNLLAPRGGFSWDMKGDGTTKLYGNLGRYYLPVTNIISTSFAGGLVDEYSFFKLNGWQQATNSETGALYWTPVIGAQIGPTDTSMNTGGDDLRGIFPKDLKAVYQDEAILGYERAINQAWSWGVNATYRRMNRTIEDTRINHSNCPSGFNWPIINPGEKNTLWCDDMGNGQGGWVELDTRVDGYKKTNGEVIGYKKPKREYKALEFQIDRAWDGKWSFNASYLWSKSTGNFEGPVNSDTGYADTGMVQYYDHPAVNERYGVLFNDHTHQIKLRGAYKLNEMWSFGSTMTVLSGGPITAYGTYWPGDNRAAGSSGEFSGGGSGWICVDKCSAATGGPGWTYASRVFKQTPMGGFGRMPWTFDWGASVTWTIPVQEVDLKVRLSVNNLLNKQTTVRVRTRYEVTPGVYRETFGEGSNWTAPRSASLVLTYNF